MPVGVLGLPIGSVLTGQPEVIGSSVLGAAAASVRFDFPPVYRAVLVEGWAQHTASSLLYVRLNGDSGANYSAQQIGAQGASVFGTRVTAQAQIAGYSVSGIGGPSSPSILIVKTTAAARAQIVMIGSINLAAGIILDLTGGEWNNTADLLNRIDLLPSTGNFDANTSITLWGFRK